MIAREERMEDRDALARFERERGRLFAIAYRMLGSVRDAEDALQDAWLRWQGVPQDEVGNPTSYLVRLVTRTCLDLLRSAHARRVEYVGPWLPEPVLEDRMARFATDPGEAQALADDLSMAFLVMLERLNPVERAVFLLRESLGFSHREVAEVVGRSEANCRQIERRARERLADGGRARPADPAQHERLTRAFADAVGRGDVDGLLRLLADDVVSYSDGNGMPGIARKPIAGALNVARFWQGLAAKRPPDAELRVAAVNGRPGLLTFIGGRLFSVISLHVEQDRIRRIFIVVTPDKLGAAQ